MKSATMSELFSRFTPYFGHFGGKINLISPNFLKFPRVGARSWLIFAHFSQLSLATVSELFASPWKCIFIKIGYNSLNLVLFLIICSLFC